MSNNLSTGIHNSSSANPVANFVQINITVAVALSICDVIGIILGSLANIVMIGLVFSQSGLQSPSDVFTSSLCVSDLLASVLFQPLVIRRLLARQNNTSYEWALRRSVGQTTLSASSLSLLVATIDRYIVLRWPLRHEYIIPKATALLVACCIWLLSLAMGTTAYLKRDLSAVVFPSIIAFIVSSICVAQIQIFVIAKKQEKKIWKNSKPTDYERKGKKFLSNMRATKTVALLLAVFLISWLPSTVFRFYDRLSGGDIQTFHRWLHPLNTLIQLHCSLDPYLYVLRNRKFKSALGKFQKRYFGAKHQSKRGTKNSQELDQRIARPEA